MSQDVATDNPFWVCTYCGHTHWVVMWHLERVVTARAKDGPPLI